MRWSGRQFLLVALLLYCWMTTIQADFPVEAADKWSWVWKALVWAIFLPLTLRTKLRIESLVLVMLLSAAAIAIAGGIKPAAGDRKGVGEGKSVSVRVDLGGCRIIIKKIMHY